jgi:Zn-dependent protease
LRFSLFAIPVEIRPSFLLIAALLGLTLNRLDLILAWVGILFVSILVHELGHALTARHYGSEVEIQLNGIGGLTSWTLPDGGITPGRRALIAAAGSATGLVFGGLIWVAALPLSLDSGIAGFTVENLVRVNVFWGLLNWLPIRPLDGGHLFTSLLERVAPRHGAKIANTVFFATAAIGFVVAIRFRLIFVALIAAWLLWGEISRLLGPGSGSGLPELDFDNEPVVEPTPAESEDTDFTPEEAVVDETPGDDEH